MQKVLSETRLLESCATRFTMTVNEVLLVFRERISDVATLQRGFDQVKSPMAVLEGGLAARRGCGAGAAPRLH